MRDWMEDGLPSRDSTMPVTMTENSRHDDAAMTVTMTDDDSSIEIDDGLYSYAEIAGLLSGAEPIKANTIAARWFPNKVLPAYEGLDCPPLRQETNRSAAGNPIYKVTRFGVQAIADYKQRVIDGKLAYEAWKTEIQAQYPAAIAPKVEVVDAEIDLESTSEIVLQQRQSVQAGQLALSHCQEEADADLDALLKLLEDVDTVNDAAFQLELQQEFNKGSKQAILLEKARLAGLSKTKERIQSKRLGE
jgi:hypothetical protein